MITLHYIAMLYKPLAKVMGKDHFRPHTGAGLHVGGLPTDHVLRFR